MFFHQDDIGLFVLLQTLPFLKFILTPQAAHFEPIMISVWWVFFKIFRLNFLPYLLFNWGLHFLTTLVLGKIVWEISHKKIAVFIAVSIFIINLTYTEVLLTMNWSPLAMFFIALAFFFWWRFITSFALVAIRFFPHLPN